MENPLISVIVPVYNVEEYLRQCIESICNQTYKNLEIILVDDGSPDHSPAICDEYAKRDSRIKVIHKENGGLSSARNAGLAVAAGEYVSFIDSDDFIKEDMYTKMGRAVEQHNADLCLCRCITYNHDGKYGSYSESSGSDDVVCSGSEMLNILVVDGAPKYVICCNKLIRRSVFDHIKFVEGKQHEDELIIHHIYGLCNKAVIIDDILYVYRIRNGSIMHQAVTYKRLDSVDALIDRAEFFRQSERKNLAELCFIQAIERFVGTTLHISQINFEAKRKIIDLRRTIYILSNRHPDYAIAFKRRLKIYLAVILIKPYVLVKHLGYRVFGKSLKR